MIYVHIDTTSNAVLSRGVHAADFVSGVVHQPKNILLLDPSSNYGEFDSHTGMKIIRGSEAVTNFFGEIGKRRSGEEIKWIDFNDPQMLKELTPLEISELLYFGHTKTHLHSPFFYKLQNNFVYFDLQDQLSRIYYRYLDEFYRILANSLTNAVSDKLNEKKSFFRKATAIEKLDFELLKELKMPFQDGVIFCFESGKQDETEFRIPIYIVEDDGLKTPDESHKNHLQIGELIYSKDQQTWHMVHDEDDLLFLPN